LITFNKFNFLAKNYLIIFIVRLNLAFTGLSSNLLNIVDLCHFKYSLND